MYEDLIESVTIPVVTVICVVIFAAAAYMLAKLIRDPITER